jgi:hypothetical protein
MMHLTCRKDEDQVEGQEEDEVEGKEEVEDEDEVEEEVHLSFWATYPLLLATWLPSMLGQSLLMRRWRWRRSLWTRRWSGRWLRRSCGLVGNPCPSCGPGAYYRGGESPPQTRQERVSIILNM